MEKRDELVEEAERIKKELEALKGQKKLLDQKSKLPNRRTRRRAAKDVESAMEEQLAEDEIQNFQNENMWSWNDVSQGGKTEGGIEKFQNEKKNYNSESQTPAEDTANPDIEELARQMMEEYVANKRDKSLQERLTREFLKSKSIAEVIGNHHDIPREQIKRHVRSPLRLPSELRRLNEDGLHPDPILSLHIALFAVNHHDWDGDEDVAEDVLHTAESIARRASTVTGTDVSNVLMRKRAKGCLNPVTASIAVWIATATLHKECGMGADFAARDIVAKTIRQNLCCVSRETILTHVSIHCVANSPYSNGMHRMLYRVRRGRYRLYRRGEPFHPAREGRTIAPSRFQLPEGYEDLRRWYDEVYCR